MCAIVVGGLDVILGVAQVGAAATQLIVLPGDIVTAASVRAGLKVHSSIILSRIWLGWPGREE